MNIGILSKFEIAGGSEFRCMALASGLARKKDSQNNFSHKVTVFSEQNICSKLTDALEETSDMIDIINFRKNPEILYEQDVILTINTDSKSFTTSEFWEEFCDPSKIKKMAFLFNFIVSPSALLNKGDNNLCNKCNDIRLITTNKRFYDELTNKPKLNCVTHLPRMILESPINIDSVYRTKSDSPIVRIGHHSKGASSKWNNNYPELISIIEESDIYDKVMWDFLGMCDSVSSKISSKENVIVRKEFSISVKDYLHSIDIYCFFIDYSRQEPWSRAVAEAMMSGCPIIATNTDGGNVMQVLHGNNGFLCNNVNEFAESIYRLVKNPELRNQMSKNSIIYSNEFELGAITDKLLRFLK